MERIAYKIALDVTKAESQKFLTGFSIGENRARVLKITLNNGRNPIHFDGTETISMFVTKPSDASPSIGLCYLEDDTIIYNVLQSDVSEEGTVKFSVKVEQLEDDLITVLYAAHFTIQVTDPECDDSHVPEDPNFSILEQLIAEVEEFDSDAEAYAVGTRGGEPVEEDDPAYHNNAKYYAENLEVEVEEQVERAEAWATGTKGGVPVSESDPQYHNNAKYYAEQADTSADNAATSESNAATSETNASGYATAAAASEANALSYKNAASGSATDASNSASAAATSESNALSYKNAASGSATNASNSASAAATSESNALSYKNAASQSATDASGSATSASGSANAASGSANTASQKALDSEAWAEGTRGGVPVGPSDPTYEKNAKYWAEQASAGQIQADWNQTDNTKKDFIKNKDIVENAIAVNMIPYPYVSQSLTEIGVHWSANADGSITIYTDAGGATGTFYGNLLAPSNHVTIPDGDYIVHYGNIVSGVSLRVQAYTKDTTPIYDHQYGWIGFNSGSGKFTKSDGDTYWTNIVMRIDSGTIIPEAQPLTVYPMLETGNVAHPFVPYIAEGSHLNEVVKSVKDSMVKSVSELKDMNISNPSNGQIFKYDAATQKWVNTNETVGIAPDNVSDIAVVAGDGTLTVKWSDPDDTVVEGQTICTWSKTKLVMKTGSYPSNEDDGTLVVTNSVRNQYETNGYTITGLVNETTYYFQLFPISDGNAVNRNVANRGNGTPMEGVLVTLTVNGGYEDVVVFKDSHDEILATCVFGTGEISGTCQFIVPIGGMNCFAESTVYKTNASTYFRKAITLTDSATQTVDAYPNVCWYWHGRKCAGNMTNISTYSGGKFYYDSARIRFETANPDYVISFVGVFGDAKSVTSGMTLHAETEYNSSITGRRQYRLDTSASSTGAGFSSIYVPPADTTRDFFTNTITETQASAYLYADFNMTGGTFGALYAAWAD